MGKVKEVKLNHFRLPRGRPGFNSPTGSKAILLTVPNTFDLALFEMHEVSVSKTRPLIT